MCVPAYDIRVDVYLSGDAKIKHRQRERQRKEPRELCPNSLVNMQLISILILPLLYTETRATRVYEKYTVKRNVTIKQRLLFSSRRSRYHVPAQGPYTPILYRYPDV